MENRDQVLTRERRDFSTIETSLSIPNLIDVQRRSYERFLQMNLLPEERASFRTSARPARWISSSTPSAIGSANAVSCRGSSTCV